MFAADTMEKAVLITGPAGSGKTAHCLRVCSEAVKKSTPGRVIYLVPSVVAVRDIERELLQGGGLRGVLAPLVMDFAKFAFRILKQAGRFPVRQIAPLERNYLIRSTIRETPLVFFENTRHHEGFAEVVADFIAELKRGMISPEDFLEGCLAAGGRGGMAMDKVHELYAIYRAYHDALKERDTYDGNGLHWKAAELLAANPSLASEVETLLVDGFATYTPVEFQMLTHLVRKAKDCHITLCYEHGRPDVFAFVEGTYAGLKGLCAAGEIRLSGNRRASGELFHLERTLFAEPENQMPAGSALSILPCRDAYREVETVAREIERMREDEGLKYSDFMVILRNVGDYTRAISEVFSERRIPFSLPEPGCLAEEPFIRATVSALRLVKGEFRREDVLSVLKSSYFTEDRDLAAAVENYAQEFGLWREDEFRQPWTETGEAAQDVAGLNEYKNRFLDRLDKLRGEASGIASAEGFRQFILHAIGELGFPSCGGQESGDSANGASGSVDLGPSFSSEYRCLAALSRLLDSICGYTGLIGLRRADYGVFLGMLERGLLWMSVPSPPRNLNSVQISPIVGGPPRLGGVVFICGLCERSFPREIVNEPFFKDRERRLINRGGKIILDEWLPLSSGERFFFYVAVSRAARRLVLTYPAVDRTGKELVRSHYVEEVARVFSDLRELSEKDATVAGVPPGREFSSLTAADELRSFVAHHLSQPRGGGEEDSDGSSTFAALTYNELLGQGALEADHLFCQAHDARLSERAVHAFQQKEAYLTSVSELETFGRCPFRHFCQYRLQLKELPRYEFGPLEEGVLYHDLLATLYREIYLKSRESGAGGIESISPEDLRQKLALLVDEFINARYSRLFRTSRMEVRRRAIRAKIKDFLLKEIENERVNSTRPAYFELSFGQGKSQQKADRRSTEASLRIGAKGGPLARISGRMDRVDLFQEGDEKFGVVLDYKRSERITGSDLRRGTVLQSGIYMLALEELFGLKAAGAFYYSIFSARKRGVFAAEEEERIAGKGDVSRTDKTSYHEIRELMELNARQALEYVSRIMQGEIGIHPADRNECRTCPFSSVCRIRDRAEVAV